MAAAHKASEENWLAADKGFAFWAVELPLADHVHRLDAGNEDARSSKGLEAQHRPYDTLDGPVVLLDDVVEVPILAHLDVRA